MHNSVLQISNYNKTSLGTGFVIDRDEEGIFLATCGHVIKSCNDSILVEGIQAEVILNKYDDGIDLAVLYVRGIFKEPLIIASEKTANEVQVIGYSKLLNDFKRESVNKIPVKFDIEFTKSEKLKIDAIKLYPNEAISKGYSGSPVICQTSNNVIGIVNIQVGEDTNYAICSKHLLDIFSVKKCETSKASNKVFKKKIVTNLGHDEIIILTNQFKANLEKSLQSFSTQHNFWIEPRLHTKEADLNPNIDDETRVDLINIITNPKSYVIKARQQFGLTCLSHYLIKEAWVNSTPSFWLYLDASQLKPHRSEISKYVSSKLKSLGLKFEDIECVILDEFSSNLEHADDILKKINDFFEDIPIILMLTLVEANHLSRPLDLSGVREFYVLHLWALEREDVRRVVSIYNDKKYIGEENKVLDKIISDLDVLNIPRTALNCLTILKISEIEFDDSPVNRTEMIKRVLFLLFNIDDIPQYKTRPDLKDTEYILGYLCELMLKSNNYYFTRENFLDTLNQFCIESEIDIDTHVIFDVLYQNNIIVMRGYYFCFKFTYWIFYFAAHRMLHNSEFAEFIMENMRYTSYPELIEFYTGIDRRRDDALKVLVMDLKNTCDVVEKKCGLPNNFNVFKFAQWKPSDDKVEQMHSEISNGVLNSTLPEIVKDQYADRTYNRVRPLNQEIHTILEEYSFLRLMKSIEASSKALRNSDYSDPNIRHELLEQILRSWEQLGKVLVVISPVLSLNGYASIEGASIILRGNFGDTIEDKINKIIQMVPTNVVNWYKDDLFSKKMGPLIYKHINEEKNEFIQHTLNLLIIKKRPRDWERHIESYIINEDKNSFFLYNIYKTLRTEYQYSFVSNGTLRTLEKLIKMTIAKHSRGIKKPSSEVIKKVSDSVLPSRNIKSNV